VQRAFSLIAHGRNRFLSEIPPECCCRG